jgi:hypothetical protein
MPTAIAQAQAPTLDDARTSWELRLTLGATALGVVVFVLQWWGLEPVVLLALTLSMWLVVAAPRFGLLLASASVAVGWLTVVFVVFTLTPAVSIDPRHATSSALLIMLAATIPLVTKVPRRHDNALPWRVLVASASGGLLWLAGLGWGLVRPGGGGWSWAMYRDSTMDLWEMRTMIEYAGVSSLAGVKNIQPLTHVVSASLVSPRVSTAASPETASAFLSGHGYHWTVTVVLASFLAGLVVYHLAVRAAAGRHTLPLLGAAVVSLGSVTHPATGVAFDLGQINVQCIFVLVLASVCAALAPRQYTPFALSVVLVAMGLLVTTWILFAAVPGLLAVFVGLRLKGLGRTRDEVLEWVLPGAAIAAWALGIYGWPLVRDIATQASTRAHLVTETTHSHGDFWLSYSNPHSIALSATVAAVAGAAGFALLRQDRWRGTVALLAAAGLVIGVLPSAVALGGFSEPLAYFPAKHLFIGTFCLVPVAVGSLLHFAGRSRVTTGVVFSVVAAALAVAIAVAEPTPTQRWALTPVDVARGEHFGTHDAVAGQFIEFASSDELRVPWRYDAQHDVTVNLMMSAVGPHINPVYFVPTRYVLRFYRNDFAASVACDLAVADRRRVVLVTRDPDLDGEIQALCPTEDIVVELVATTAH